MSNLRDLDTIRNSLRNEARLEQIAQNLYGIELRTNSNDDWKACCPFHQEDTPSFGIRVSKQLYHCFGCKAGGDIFAFVQAMDNVDHVTAIRKIAEFVSFDLSSFERPLTDNDKKQATLYAVNKEVADGHSSTKALEFRQWRKGRRLDPDVLTRYSVGYCRDGDPTGHVASATGGGAFTELELDWTTKWTNSIVVPLRDTSGRVTGFCNRLLGDSQVKVIGPKSSHPLPQPSIYGLYEARQYIRQAGYIILVEGEVDVWQMAAHGYPNVAAMRGTKLNDDMLALLTSLSINSVIVMADNDEAGRKFTQSVAETRIGSKISIKIAILKGDGKDPDEILLANGADAIGECIAEARSAFEYLIDKTCADDATTSATDKLDVLNKLKPYLVPALDIERELACRLLATKLSLDYEVLADFFRENDGETVELYNTNAEKFVLQHMLSNEEFIGEALMALQPTDFYLTKYRHTYEAISKLYRKQLPVGVETVKTLLENEGRTFEKGLAVERTGDSSSASYMLADLKDKAIRRSVQKRAKEAVGRLGDTRSDAKAVIQKLSADLATAVVGEGGKLIDASTLAYERVSIMHERIKAPNAIIGLDLGPDFPILNHTLHGLQRKRYIIVSAPAGTGKTALAGVIARISAIELREPTLYFTFETGTEALADRLIASIAGVESDKIITGHVTAAEAKLVQDAAALVAASPLVLTERGIAFEECASIMRHDVLRRGTRIVFVDYIQLMHLASADRMPRYQEIGEISRGMLELAKELDITIVCLAQQNRESANSGSNEKEGIGGSYEIAQDADAMIIFREKTKDEIKADGDSKGNRVAKLAKNRHGRGGVTFNMQADLDVMRIREYNQNRKPTH